MSSVADTLAKADFSRENFDAKRYLDALLADNKQALEVLPLSLQSLREEREAVVRQSVKHHVATLIQSARVVESMETSFLQINSLLGDIAIATKQVVEEAKALDFVRGLSAQDAGRPGPPRPAGGPEYAFRTIGAAPQALRDTDMGALGRLYKNLRVYASESRIMSAAGCLKVLGAFYTALRYNKDVLSGVRGVDMKAFSKMLLRAQNLTTSLLVAQALRFITHHHRSALFSPDALVLQGSPSDFDLSPSDTSVAFFTDVIQAVRSRALATAAAAAAAASAAPGAAAGTPGPASASAARGQRRASLKVVQDAGLQQMQLQAQEQRAASRYMTERSAADVEPLLYRLILSLGCTGPIFNALLADGGAGGGGRDPGADLLRQVNDVCASDRFAVLTAFVSTLSAALASIYDRFVVALVYLENAKCYATGASALLAVPGALDAPDASSVHAIIRENRTVSAILWINRTIRRLIASFAAEYRRLLSQFCLEFLDVYILAISDINRRLASFVGRPIMVQLDLASQFKPLTTMLLCTFFDKLSSFSIFNYASNNRYATYCVDVAAGGAAGSVADALDAADAAGAGAPGDRQQRPVSYCRLGPFSDSYVRRSANGFLFVGGLWHHDDLNKRCYRAFDTDDTALLRLFFFSQPYALYAMMRPRAYLECNPRDISDPWYSDFYALYDVLIAGLRRPGPAGARGGRDGRDALCSAVTRGSAVEEYRRFAAAAHDDSVVAVTLTKATSDYLSYHEHISRFVVSIFNEWVSFYDFRGVFEAFCNFVLSSMRMMVQNYLLVLDAFASKLARSSLVHGYALECTRVPHAPAAAPAAPPVAASPAPPMPPMPAAPASPASKHSDMGRFFESVRGRINVDDAGVLRATISSAMYFLVVFVPHAHGNLRKASHLFLDLLRTSGGFELTRALYRMALMLVAKVEATVHQAMFSELVRQLDEVLVLYKTDGAETDQALQRTVLAMARAVQRIWLDYRTLLPRRLLQRRMICLLCEALLYLGSDRLLDKMRRRREILTAAYAFSLATGSVYVADYFRAVLARTCRAREISQELIVEHGYKDALDAVSKAGIGYDLPVLV